MHIPLRPLLKLVTVTLAISFSIVLGANDTDAGTVLPDDLTVDTVLDNPLLASCQDGVDNDCSLRGAIINSNANLGLGTIGFAIAPGGVQTIVLDALYGELPVITEGVAIDGGTQADLGTPCTGPQGERPCIGIDGAATSGSGILTSATGTSVRGLSIYSFVNAMAIGILDGTATIAGNFLGTPDGVTDAGNNVGVRVDGGVGPVTIGGLSSADRNVISANDFGVLLDGDGTIVQGNYIGTDKTGALALGNDSGIEARSGEGSTIGGTSNGARNIVSGNFIGIQVSDANNVRIQGNHIGTNQAGTTSVANQVGVSVNGDPQELLIGGSTAAARNVISGNTEAGIDLSGQQGAGALIEGNYVGLNSAGNAAVGNLQGGIALAPDGATHSASNNEIVNNVISGNTIGGIRLAPGTTATTNGNMISGNIIGLNAAGTASVPNDGDGIFISSEFGGEAINNSINTDDSGDGNVISGNAGDGIALRGIMTSQTGIFHNLIGTNAAGTLPQGNSGFGVSISLEAHDNYLQYNTIAANVGGVSIADTSVNNQLLVNSIGTNEALAGGLGNTFYGVGVFGNNNFIGSTAAPLAGPGGGGNVIRNNGGAGVLVNIADNVNISANSIDDNVGEGIELNNGGNNDQPAPVLSAATSVGGNTNVAGMLIAAPSTAYRVEFFASPSCDLVGSGEGRDYLGAALVNTTGAGVAVINTPLPGDTSGQSITATASDPSNNTSEFSNCALVPGASPTPTPSPSPTESASPTPTATPLSNKMGDADCDGLVDADDVFDTLADAAEIVEADCHGLADTDCDGDVDGEDALRILLFLAGVPLPVSSGCFQIGSPTN